MNDGSHVAQYFFSLTMDDGPESKSDPEPGTKWKWAEQVLKAERIARQLEYEAAEAQQVAVEAAAKAAQAMQFVYEANITQAREEEKLKFEKTNKVEQESVQRPSPSVRWRPRAINILNFPTRAARTRALKRTLPNWETNSCS